MPRQWRPGRKTPSCPYRLAPAALYDFSNSGGLVFDTLFSWLFTYRPVVFEQGEFRFDPSTGSYIAAALGVTIVATAVMTYRKTGGRGKTRDRVILLALRSAILGLLLLCLFRPVLVVKAAVPQQNVLGILLDDSRSMQVADWDGRARAEFVRQTFGKDGSPLMRALSDHFVVRLFRFSSAPARIDSASDLA